MAVRATDVAEELQASGVSGRVGDGHGHAEQGVGAQTGLVLGAIELQQGLVDEALVVSLQASQGVVDLGVDEIDSLGNALAQVAISAVAQLVRLVHTGGRARRHGGTAHRTVVEDDLDLDGGVTAGVHDLQRADVKDSGHLCLPPRHIRRCFDHWRGRAEPGTIAPAPDPKARNYCSHLYFAMRPPRDRRSTHTVAPEPSSATMGP